MSSRYSIIQYVPDPIADERINIGVLAFDDQKVRVYFLHNWERVRNFGSEDIDFLKDFAEKMQESAEIGLLFPGDQLSDIPRHERLLKVAQSWMNSIQFTEPRGSLEKVDELFADTIKRFLVDIPKSRSKFRDRQAAARLTVSKVKQVVKELIGKEYQDLVKAKYMIPGQRKEHDIDIAIANGHPYLAAQGISFEVHTPENVLDALAWTISDIKDKNSDFPLAVVVLPPIKQDKHLEKIYHDTIATYSELGAQILQEGEIKNWITSELSQQDDLREKMSLVSS